MMKINRNKIALLLGTVGFGSGSIETTLKSNGYYYIRKHLNSSVQNWNSIYDIMDSNSENIKLIQMKLTEYIIFLLCLPQYAEIRKMIETELLEKPHQIFIYNENLFKKFSCVTNTRSNKFVTWQDIRSYFDFLNVTSALDSWCKLHNYPRTPEQAYYDMSGVVETMVKNGFNIVPYKKLIDIDTSGQSFIENTINGLVLRVYVPNERLWSRELDRMMTLFRDYVSEVSNKSVQLFQNRTGSGVTTSLYSSDRRITPDEMRKQFDEFAIFLDLCDKDMNQAINLLNRFDVPKEKALKIVSRYTKEAKRLMLDLNQEKESRLLAIRHALENQLNEAQFLPEVVNTVEKLLPDVSSPSALLRNTGITTLGDSNRITVTFNQQIIDMVDGIVIQNLEGTFNYSANDIELRKLIDQYSKSQAEQTELRSSLDELRDQEVPKDQRIGAWQKLSCFLSRMTSKVGDVGITLLTSYIAELLKGIIAG